MVSQLYNAISVSVLALLIWIILRNQAHHLGPTSYRSLAAV